MALLLTGIGVGVIDDSLPACLASVDVISVLFAVWIQDVVGGGDIKLWTATVMLWQSQPEFLLDAAVLGGVLALVYLVLSLFVPRRMPSGKGQFNRFLYAEL